MQSVGTKLCYCLLQHERAT